MTHERGTAELDELVEVLGGGAKGEEVGDGELEEDESLELGGEREDVGEIGSSDRQ
jgi:hypothetical protein